MFETLEFPTLTPTLLKCPLSTNSSWGRGEKGIDSGRNSPVWKGHFVGLQSKVRGGGEGKRWFLRKLVTTFQKNITGLFGSFAT